MDASVLNCSAICERYAKSWTLPPIAFDA